MDRTKALSVLFLRFCIQYSSIALLYYDYALTWTREVKYMWLQKFTVSTALYIACRYALVANVIYTLALAEKLPTMSCDAGYQICAILSVIGRAAILVTWGARTYAVFNRNKFVLIFFGGLGAFIIVLASWYIPYIACNGSKGKAPKVTEYLNMLTVIFETLSTILTTVKGFQSIRLDGTWRLYKKGLIYLIIEQGLLYFALVSGFSFAAMVLQFEGKPGTFTQRLLNALTMPLSGQMTARFLLHLRQWDYEAHKSGGGNYSMFSGAESEIPIEFRAPDARETRFSGEVTPDGIELRRAGTLRRLSSETNKTPNSPIRPAPPAADDSTDEARNKEDKYGPNYFMAL